MHKFKVEDPAGLMVGSGEIVGLTLEQLATRSHRVEVLDGKPSALTRVRVLDPVQFKAGEELQFERAPKDGTGTAPLAKPPTAAKAPKARKSDIEKAYADGVAEGREAMLAEVVARNALWEEVEASTEAANAAQQAHDAEADDAKRGPLKEALVSALQRKVAAEKAVKDLPELKA